MATGETLLIFAVLTSPIRISSDHHFVGVSRYGHVQMSSCSPSKYRATRFSLASVPVLQVSTAPIQPTRSNHAHAWVRFPRETCRVPGQDSFHDFRFNALTRSNRDHVDVFLVLQHRLHVLKHIDPRLHHEVVPVQTHACIIVITQTPSLSDTHLALATASQPPFMKTSLRRNSCHKRVSFDQPPHVSAIWLNFCLWKCVSRLPCLRERMQQHSGLRRSCDARVLCDCDWLLLPRVR